MIRAIVTDIEGTTTSISFVKDVLFPYARKRLPAYVVTHADRPDVQHWLHEVALEAELVSATQQEIIDLMLEWIDADRKSTGLKALQGLIWEDGYRDGEFVAHVYPDVAPMLRRWRADGVDLYVYSSGSVSAQKLLFAHTDAREILFLSDTSEEIDAATAAGMHAIRVVRDGKPSVEKSNSYVTNFESIDITTFG